MSTVTITIQNDDVMNTKLQNISTYIYTTGAVFVTSGITNSSGVITISLADGSYDLLFFSYGFSVVQPQRIVVDSSLINHFLITGHMRTMPESLNPDLCRVSGYIYGPDGKPRKDATTRFNQKKRNEIVSGNEVLNIPISFHSDENGYFQFDLYREMLFESYIDGYEHKLYSKVPNYPSVDLFKLLFPLQVLITHPGTMTTTLSSGPISGSFTVYYNDGNTGLLHNEFSKILYTLDNPDILAVTFTKTQVDIIPYATGTCHITFSRIIDEHYIWRQPDPFVASTLTITIT